MESKEIAYRDFECSDFHCRYAPGAIDVMVPPTEGGFYKIPNCPVCGKPMNAKVLQKRDASFKIPPSGYEA